MYEQTHVIMQVYAHKVEGLRGRVSVAASGDPQRPGTANRGPTEATSLTSAGRPRNREESNGNTQSRGSGGLGPPGSTLRATAQLANGQQAAVTASDDEHT